MIARRTLLAGAALAPALFVARRAAALKTVASTAFRTKLIYVSPLKSDGTPSRCKAEIWFAELTPHENERDLFVVTPADAWRTRAIGLGLDRAKLWDGDHGVWTDSDEFLKAYSVVARASIESRGDVQARVLKAMAVKYADDGWRRWGPRFRAGLDSGDRVMIHYAAGMSYNELDEEMSRIRDAAARLHNESD